MDMKKKVWIILGVVVAVIAAGILLFKFGWRLMGLRGCDSPNNLMVSQCTIEDDNVKMIGGPTGSMQKYEGYTIQIESDTLYIGVKMRNFWANSAEGRFALQIPIGNNVKKVVLSNGDHEKDRLLLERE